LNEHPTHIESIPAQQVTTCDGPVGVAQEYLPFTGGRRVTLTDAGLVSVVKSWLDLPESIRKEVEALCIQPVS
jgi:hypothetical protein